jgi:prefoldin subunit 5
MKMETDKTITALRDELRRLRIERTGLMTDIQELEAEVARLRAENNSLRGLHARRL